GSPRRSCATSRLLVMLSEPFLSLHRNGRSQREPPPECAIIGIVATRNSDGPFGQVDGSIRIANRSIRGSREQPGRVVASHRILGEIRAACSYSPIASFCNRALRRELPKAMRKPASFCCGASALCH